MREFNYQMMSTLLRETEQEHAKVEKTLPKHDWQDWYAVYMIERMRGEERTREMAAQAAIAAIQYLKAAPVVSKDEVTIIDGPMPTEVCDECGADIPVQAPLENDWHADSCSLHEDNVVDDQAGYTTLQAIGGILGASLLLAVLILLIPIGHG